ncbi:MAG: hypothetical protein K0S33_3464 [Bacteroidetes bacterium]|jgi:hypothetical protein|nr:hypothetical protein [Bacteroidota bacterium]
METTPAEAPKKRKWLSFTLFILITTLVIVAIVYIKKSSDLEEQAKNSELQYQELTKKIAADNSVILKETRRADSVQKILTRVGDYLPMALTLQYRDSITTKLVYEPGDVVKMKPDSSVWVIVNVNVKGGKWQHQVSYTLRDKTGKQIEVEPEILY